MRSSEQRTFLRKKGVSRRSGCRSRKPSARLLGPTKQWRWRMTSSTDGCAKSARLCRRYQEVTAKIERQFMMPKYTIEYTTQFKKHAQTNHYSTDDRSEKHTSELQSHSFI